MTFWWWVLWWCLHSWNPEPPFPVFSLITYQEINILLFGVFMILGKQKTPGDIPPGVFCFPQGKQKTPSAIHIILWFKLWIAPGVFCFPRITLKSQCTDFKNCFNQVINEISENASSRKLENQNWFSQPLVHTVIGRTRALRALVLSITVWTRGWENPVLVFQLPGKDTFLQANK